MTYPDFVKEVLGVKHDHVREDSPAYTELVIPRGSLDAMLGVMDRFFGGPAKAEGQKPSPEQKHMTLRHGGIRPDQILYVRNDAADSALAMFWPWSSGELITVKIFRDPRPEAQTEPAETQAPVRRPFLRFPRLFGGK